MLIYCVCSADFVFDYLIYYSRRRSRRSRAFIHPVRMCVCMCVYVSSLTQKHWTYHHQTGRWIVHDWIVHDKSWSSILFEVKRLNVKVTGSVSVKILQESHSKTKSTGHIITKHGRWIVYGKSWSPIWDQKVRCQGRREFALF